MDDVPDAAIFALIVFLLALVVFVGVEIAAIVRSERRD